MCGCSKDDDQPTNPVDQLPPETQSGANTFGALLDGEPFIPSGGVNPLDCVYQFVNGNYFFALQGNKRNENNSLILLGLGTNSLEINENITYELRVNAPDNAFATYALGGNFFETNSNQTGQMTITHLDLENQTVSGTFWFDVIDQNGDLKQIREGRFDMQFTQ